MSPSAGSPINNDAQPSLRFVHSLSDIGRYATPSVGRVLMEYYVFIPKV